MIKTIEQLVDNFLLVKKALPEITYAGNPVLRRRAKAVALADGLLVAKKLMKTLKKYRELTGMGRGLAAPQIGIDSSVFVTFVDNAFQIYINPRIVRASKKHNYFRELCISSGILWGDVKRAEKITLGWTDERGKKQLHVFDGFMARLLQHEYDHLLGVVNLDKAESGSIEFCLDDVTKEQLRDVSSF